MSLPADSSCEGRVSLHFTQLGLSIPAIAGVVVERGSEYILAHTGPRELDGHPLGGCGSGFWFSSRLYYPFGKGPGQHIIRCLKNKKCENERTQMSKPAMVILTDQRLREWESGNDSFPFLRTLREWEGQWGIRKNFAHERNCFLRIASNSERQFASITIFLGVQVSPK